MNSHETSFTSHHTATTAAAANNKPLKQYLEESSAKPYPTLFEQQSPTTGQPTLPRYSLAEIHHHKNVQISLHPHPHHPPDDIHKPDLRHPNPPTSPSLRSSASASSSRGSNPNRRNITPLHNLHPNRRNLDPNLNPTINSPRPDHEPNECALCILRRGRSCDIGFSGFGWKWESERCGTASDYCWGSLWRKGTLRWISWLDMVCRLRQKPICDWD